MKSVDILTFEKYNKKYDKVKVQFVFFCTECGGKTVEDLELWGVMNETQDKMDFWNRITCNVNGMQLKG